MIFNDHKKLEEIPLRRPWTSIVGVFLQLELEHLLCWLMTCFDDK